MLETTVVLSSGGALDVTSKANSEDVVAGFTGCVIVYLLSDDLGNRLPWYATHQVGANARSGSTEQKRFTVPQEELSKVKAVSLELLHCPKPEEKFRHFANVLLKDAATAAKHIGEIFAEGAKMYAATQGG